MWSGLRTPNHVAVTLVVMQRASIVGGAALGRGFEGVSAGEPPDLFGDDTATLLDAAAVLVEIDGNLDLARRRCGEEGDDLLLQARLARGPRGIRGANSGAHSGCAAFG